jgi:hypothetical protein
MDGGDGFDEEAGVVGAAAAAAAAPPVAAGPEVGEISMGLDG